jgi:hypothetical protein
MLKLYIGIADNACCPKLGALLEGIEVTHWASLRLSPSLG